MAKKEKEFNLKLYGISAIIIVAAVLALLTVVTFVSRYTAFKPDKIARAYVSTIVESGDGYNAYKNSLLSKDMKYGDFIRVNYIYPEIYEDYEIGGSTKGLKGLNDSSLMNDYSKRDDGSLEGKLIDEMYPVFVSLLESNGGWDSYDVIFKAYITELKAKRQEVFGDTYFDDETFFTCLEANVSAYGDSLTGTQDEFDKNTGVQTSFASQGVYQTKYGDDYKFTYEIAGLEDRGLPEGGAFADIIKDSKTVTVSVIVNGDTEVASVKVPVVKIGSSWYVDNSSCDTSSLYSFYK